VACCWTPRPLFGAPPSSSRVESGWPGAPYTTIRWSRYGSLLCAHDALQARQADITSKVCQGPLFPKGYARFRWFTVAFLSQASHLGSLLLPQDAFQEHAAHILKWSKMLSSKGSERTCIRSGLATFLHCAFTAHTDFVVAQEASDVESSSRLDFLVLHNFRRWFVAWWDLK